MDMTRADRFWSWLAWKLPRRLAYWASIRVSAYATMGEYGNTSPNDISIMDALRRWDHA
jgi:hypothetical protein